MTNAGKTRPDGSSVGSLPGVFAFAKPVATGGIFVCTKPVATGGIFVFAKPRRLPV